MKYRCINKEPTAIFNWNEYNIGFGFRNYVECLTRQFGIRFEDKIAQWPLYPKKKYEKFKGTLYLETRRVFLTDYYPQVNDYVLEVTDKDVLVKRRVTPTSLCLKGKVGPFDVELWRTCYLTAKKKKSPHIVYKYSIYFDDLRWDPDCLLTKEYSIEGKWHPIWPEDIKFTFDTFENGINLLLAYKGDGHHWVHNFAKEFLEHQARKHPKRSSGNKYTFIEDVFIYAWKEIFLFGPELFLKELQSFGLCNDRTTAAILARYRTLNKESNTLTKLYCVSQESIKQYVETLQDFTEKSWRNIFQYAKTRLPDRALDNFLEELKSIQPRED